MRYSGRDRSGRVPRASRSDVFYQAINPVGPERPIEPPTDPEPHTENYDRSDIVRGQGY